MLRLLPDTARSPRTPRRGVRLAPATRFGRIVVALDGSDNDTVLAATRALVDERGARPLFVAAEPENAEVRSAPRAQAVQAGRTAQRVASLAREENAALVLLGAVRHDVFDQLLGAELPLRVLRLVDRPVMVVVPSRPCPPRRVVIATALDAAAARAARTAAALVADHGTLLLAHVVPPRSRGCAARAAQERHARECLEAMARALRTRTSAAVSTTVLHGDPTTALLSLAADHGADLLAAGVSGAHGCERMFVGSVATHLLRRARCSLLLSPP